MSGFRMWAAFIAGEAVGFASVEMGAGFSWWWFAIWCAGLVAFLAANVWQQLRERAS